MRYSSSLSTAFLPAVVAIAAGLLPMAPAGVSAQSEPPDSSDLVKAVRNRQTDFELFRQSRIPVDAERTGGGCDQRIGRICIWFGGEGELDFPPERPEVALARNELVQLLSRTAEQIADPWVTGQLVHYLVESGSSAQAEQVVSECRLAETWWCSALRGYVLHVRGDFIEAEAAFREAVASMPEKEREEWVTLRYSFTGDGAKEFDRADPEDQEGQWELFWRLSDPLFLLEGNDRFTDQFARWVEARNHEDAEHPQGMFWEEDLEETLIRYGRIQGWSRTHNPGAAMRGGRRSMLQDTRRIVGHHHPKSRGYLFPEDFLESPSDIRPESWITAPREARTWYAPPYAPDFRGLETQVGRFRRGEEMLVVGAYRPASVSSGTVATEGPLQAALFLIPEDGGAVSEVRGSDAEGTFTLRAAPGRYVSSLEVLDAEGKRAWRARQGVKQVPMVRGLVAVSDLLILREGAAFPASLDEAIPDVRRGVRIRKGERFTVVWEVYGLQVQDPAQVTLGFTEGRPGFLERVGDFLGMLEPDQPVEVTFADAGSDGVQSAFRAVALELPDLEPGEYTLHLRLDLPGREPSITSRPIVVDPPAGGGVPST
jgi:hypothetical protein